MGNSSSGKIKILDKRNVNNVNSVLQTLTVGAGLIATVISIVAGIKKIKGPDNSK